MEGRKQEWFWSSTLLECGNQIATWLCWLVLCCFTDAHLPKTGFMDHVAEICQLTPAAPHVGAAIGSSEAQAPCGAVQECTGADGGPVHKQQQPGVGAQPSLPHSKASLVPKAGIATLEEPLQHSSNADVACAAALQPEHLQQQEQQACDQVTPFGLLPELSQTALGQRQEAQASRGQIAAEGQPELPGSQTGTRSPKKAGAGLQAEGAMPLAAEEDVDNRLGTGLSQQEAVCADQGQQLLLHSLAGR